MEECTWEEILGVRVWDIPQGRWANSIENGLMDLYETLVPSGYNQIRANFLGDANRASLGANAAAKWSKDNSEKASEIGKKGGKHSSAWSDQHPEKALERNKKGASVLHSIKNDDGKSAAGFKGGSTNARNKTGVCGRSPEKMSADGRKGGLANRGKKKKYSPKYRQSNVNNGKLGSELGNHKRWHELKGVVNLACKICNPFDEVARHQANKQRGKM